MAIDPYKAPESQVHAASMGAIDPLDALPAPHGKRWLASFIDNMLVILPLMAVLFGGVFLIAMNDVDAGNDLNDNLFANAFGLAFQVMAVGGQILYGAVFESSGWHATPGKKLMGLVVVDDNGEYLSFGAAAGRNAAKFIGLAMCGLLAISVLIDDLHRGVWDRVVNTRVITRNPYAS